MQTNEALTLRSKRNGVNRINPVKPLETHENLENFALSVERLHQPPPGAFQEVSALE